MEKQKRTMTNEEAAALKTAENEAQFQARDLLAEIQPLLSDYFFGEFERNEDTLVCSFPNGQRIKLIVE